MTETPKKLIPYDFSASISQPFRLRGGRGFLLRLGVAASLLLILVYVVFGRSVISAYMDFFQAVVSMEDPEDPVAIGEMMTSMYGIMLPFTGIWLGSWCVMVATETAFHLNNHKGVDRGMFPLRFGMPELSVWVAQLVVGLIVFGVYFAGYLILIMVVLMAALSAEASQIFAMMAGMLAFVVAIVWLVAMAVAAIRLSPAAALSVRDGDIRTVEGWAITKGRFWPMLGGYAVISIIGYFASLIVMTLAFFIAFGGMSTFAPLAELGDNADPQVVFDAVRDIFGKPRIVAGMIVAGFLGTLFHLFWKSFMWGVPSYVVKLSSIEPESEA